MYRVGPTLSAYVLSSVSIRFGAVEVLRSRISGGARASPRRGTASTTGGCWPPSAFGGPHPARG
eukprot:4166095-Pyramimonas_sp.AAC.1